LPADQAPVLVVEQGHDDAALAAEVVVDLAERHAGAVGDPAGGQVDVPVGEQARPGGLHDSGGRVVGQDRALPSTRVLFGRSTE
jgi:hypothetical protein